MLLRRQYSQSKLLIRWSNFSKSDNLTFTPTSCCDVPVFEHSYLSHVSLVQRVQHCECLPKETVCLKRCSITPTFKRYLVSPFSMTADFSPCPPVWPFRTAINTFDFQHAWITHPTNHFISSITRLLVCVTSLEKRPRLATMSQAGLWGTALYIDFELSNTSPSLHSHTLWSTTTTSAQTASHFRFIQTLIYTFWVFSPPNTVQPSYSNWLLVNPSWPARPAPAGCPL